MPEQSRLLMAWTSWGLKPSEDGDGTQGDPLHCLPHGKTVSVYSQPETLILTYTDASCASTLHCTAVRNLTPYPACRYCEVPQGPTKPSSVLGVEPVVVKAKSLAGNSYAGS